MVLSLPSAEQAKLSVEAIRSMMEQLDGKWLAPKPTQQLAQGNHVSHSSNGINNIDWNVPGTPPPPLKSPSGG